MGLSAGFNRYQFRYNEITFKTIDNTTQNLGDFNTTTPDFGAGLYLKSKGFFVGLSFTHLWSKNLYEIDVRDSSFNSNLTYRLRTHSFFTMGKSWVLNKNVVFAPTLLLRSVGNGSGNLDINLNFFLYKKITTNLKTTLLEFKQKIITS